VVGDDIEKDSVTKPPKTINRRTRWRLRAKRKRKSNDKKYMQGPSCGGSIEFHLSNFKQKILVQKDSRQRTQVLGKSCLSAIEERFISSP